MLNVDQASDYEEPLSTALVLNESSIEDEDVYMLDYGDQDDEDIGAVPAEDEQSESINLLIQRANDALIEYLKNGTIDIRELSLLKKKVKKGKAKVKKTAAENTE